MRIISANIKCNPKMSQPRVVHDVNAVGEQHAGIIGWQEIAIPRYAQAVEALADYETYHGDHECPISYKPRFWVPEGTVRGAIKTHDGRSGVTPSRYFVYIALRPKDSLLPPVVFMNTHMISGAWSNHYPLTRAWRRKMWELHFKIQQDKVFDLVHRGFTVIGTGDTNRGDSMPKFMPNQRWISTGGIDHIWCVEAPLGAKVAIQESYPYEGQVYTDHKPRIANLHLSRNHAS